MKEVITVELEKADVEAAIEDFLLKHGYEVKNTEFKCKGMIGGIELIGATAIVTKKLNVEEA